MLMLRSGKVDTGAIEEATLPFKKWAVSAFGSTDDAVVNLTRIQAISNYLAPKMRPVGSGSTSDMEFKAYMRAILSVDNEEKSNYISLYMFKKMTQNSARLNQRELELYAQNYSPEAVNQTLREEDKGIFAKYDPENDGKFDDWWNSLPAGEVVINQMANGNPLTDDDSFYLIKGWYKK